MEIALVVALALAWATILFEAWLLYHLVRRYGQALLNQDELSNRLLAVEHHLQELSNQNAGSNQIAQTDGGLPVGSFAPAFGLPDLDGHERTLNDFLDRPLLVIFFNPTCHFCSEMAPRLGKLPQDGARVLLISRGDAQANQRLWKENNWSCDVLLDRGWEITNAFRSNATPTGYLLDTQGRTTTSLIVGADALLQLVSATPAQRDDEHSEALTLARLREKEQVVAKRARDAGLRVRESRLNREGLKVGTRAPDFTLLDLNGLPHSLNEFRGLRVLLLFSAPDCGPCQTLATSLEAMSQKYVKDHVQLVMITRGDPEANRAKAKEHGFSFPVLMQRHWEVSKEYALFATPIAYLIDENGIIAKDVAIGANAILQLV